MSKKIVAFPKISQKDLQSSTYIPKDYENFLLTAGNDLHVRYWNLTSGTNYHINNFDGKKRNYNTIPGDITILNESLAKPELESSKDKNGAKKEDKSFSDFQYKNGYSLGPDKPVDKYFLASASHKDVINDMLFMDKNDILVTCSRDHTIKLWK